MATTTIAIARSEASSRANMSARVGVMLFFAHNDKMEPEAIPEATATAVKPPPTELKNSITADILTLRMKSVGKTANNPFYVLENGNGRFLQLFYCQYEESMGLSK
jgi:hypothetical protein